jgi:hypothetical protein
MQKERVSGEVSIDVVMNNVGITSRVVGWGRGGKRSPKSIESWRGCN